MNGQFTQQLKPDFALIGEVLHGDYNQIVNDEMLDSCTKTNPRSPTKEDIMKIYIDLW